MSAFLVHCLQNLFLGKGTIYNSPQGCVLARAPEEVTALDEELQRFLLEAVELLLVHLRWLNQRFQVYSSPI